MNNLVSCKWILVLVVYNCFSPLINHSSFLLNFSWEILHFVHSSKLFCNTPCVIAILLLYSHPWPENTYENPILLLLVYGLLGQEHTRYISISRNFNILALSFLCFVHLCPLVWIFSYFLFYHCFHGICSYTTTMFFWHSPVLGGPCCDILHCCAYLLVFTQRSKIGQKLVKRMIKLWSL